LIERDTLKTRSFLYTSAIIFLESHLFIFVEFFVVSDNQLSQDDRQHCRKGQGGK